MGNDLRRWADENWDQIYHIVRHVRDAVERAYQNGEAAGRRQAVEVVEGAKVMVCGSLEGAGWMEYAAKNMERLKREIVDEIRGEG